MNAIETISFQPARPVAKIGCCDRFSRCLAKIKKLVIAFFQWLFCCQEKPRIACNSILQEIAQYPRKGNGFIEQCNLAAARESSAKGFMGPVNWVPGEYDLHMKGIALVITHLKTKYKLKNFYSCKTLKGFAQKLQTFAKAPKATRGVFIVPTFGSGNGSTAQWIAPNFPQHKIAVLVEKEASGQIKLAIIDPQGIGNMSILPQNIEGCREIWDGWEVPGRFNCEELILRAVVVADLPKETQLFYSTVVREHHYGCAHYALQDGVAFLRDPHFFDNDKMIAVPTGTKIGGMSLGKITQLPPAFMIGTQSLKTLREYEQANQGESLVVKQKGQQTKTLSDYQKKYVVDGRNHYISVKIARYYQIVFQMLKEKTPVEIAQCLSRTLVE